MLTSRQKQVLDYIRGSVGATGVCPSYEDIAIALKFVNRGHAHTIVTRLVERGHLRRLPNRARALEIVDKSEAVPLVTYPDAVYFKFDDDTQELVEWRP